MLLGRIAGVFLVITCSAVPQDLAPEVLLLARIKVHLDDELSKTPNYTCLETIDRFHADPPPSPKSRPPLKPLDTVALEIVYTDHHEWFGSPGDRKLSVENPMAFVGFGMMGNGAFGMTVHNIVAGADFTYRGEVPLDGRPAIRYDFRLPQLLKPLRISLPGGIGTVGEEGSIWVHPGTFDLMRLESHAIEIPPFLPLAEGAMNVDYARVQIGGYSALLAQTADSRLVESDGTENYNRLEFTHCRAYSAQSEIRFEGALPATPPTAAQPYTERAAETLPGLLAVTIELTTPVSPKDMVGKLIEGKLAGDVIRKGKLLAAAGTPVRGRIRRLEYDHSARAKQLIIGLEFTEVETSDGPLLFYADLLSAGRNPAIRQKRIETVLVRTGSGVEARDRTVTLPELPGVASFFVSGPAFTIPRGFRTVWRTRGPLR